LPSTYFLKLDIFLGFNPVWDETLTFDLNAPELALIRFELRDEDFGKDTFIAQSVVPFASLRPGMSTFVYSGIEMRRLTNVYT